MDKKHKCDKQRRGSVLIIVVGLLAVMMVFASTMAIMSRVEMKTGQNYETREQLNLMQVAVEQYCIEILQQDKYGSDGVPYNYEKGADTSIYSTMLEGNDENFDAYKYEEWLPENSTSFDYKLAKNDSGVFTREIYNGVDSKVYAAQWNNCDEILDTPAVGGGKKVAQCAILFFDAGAGRLNINMVGNSKDGTNAHDQYQNQGISTFETGLDGILGATLAKDVVSDRYAETSPYAPVEDTFIYGLSNLDFNADGSVNGTPSGRTPVADGYFNPEWPQGGELPYTVRQLSDLLFREDSGTYLGTQPNGIKDLLTTHSATTIIAGCSIRDTAIGTPPDVFASTNPSTMVSADTFMHANLSTFTARGQTVALQRAIQSTLGDTAQATATEAENLGEFIWKLDPELTVGDDTEIHKVIIQQTAMNLLDMVDTGNSPISLSRSDFDDSPEWPNNDGSGSGTTYEMVGVERTPYIAEVMPVVNSRRHPYVPNPDTGTYDGSHLGRTYPVSRLDNDENIVEIREGEDGDGKQVFYYDVEGSDDYTDGTDYKLWEEDDTVNWSSITDLGPASDSDSDNPPAGWGKYIKLVNPWNEKIDLEGYEISFDGKGWEWDDNNNEWTTKTISNVQIAIGSNSNKEIPARGHFLLIDALQDQDNTNVFGSLPNSNYYQEAPKLTYLRDGIEVTLSDPDGNIVMKTTLGDLPSNHNDDEDGEDRPESVQIGDPRPCWLRPDRNGDDLDGNSDAIDVQDKAWGPDAWETKEKTVGWDSSDSHWEWEDTDTNALTWFNRDWRDKTQADSTIYSGDNYYRVHASDLNTVPPADTDNLLASFPPADTSTSMGRYTGVSSDQTQIMNNGILPSPGAVGFVHASIPWGTVSLTNPSTPEVIGADSVVYLRNFTDYLLGPVSPYENGVDDDGDGEIDSADTGAQTGDRFGPEIRQRGKVNVNTAPPAVLEALLKDEILNAPWYSGDGKNAADIAAAIVNERDGSGSHGGDADGPFSSVDDFFSRVPELFGSDGSSDLLNIPNSPRREALARFMYNLVTVRTDVWGVIAQVGLKDTGAGNVIASKKFYLVIDRSFNPPRIIMRRQIEE